MVLVGGALATVLAVGAAAVFGVRLFADGPKKFATVAHGCDMVSAATLRKWVPDSSVRLADDDPVESEKTLFYDSTGCEWGSHGRPRTWGNLDISVSVGHDVSQRVADELGDGDAPDGADRAADAQRDKLASARQRAKNPDHGPHAVVEGTPVTVPGIGDEAFAYSIVGKDSEMADLMTVKLEARWGNAAITVEYNAMRYDAAHHGSATSESTARAGAEAAARDIVHYLADCTACLRGAGT
jgi:hypothetical protein